MIPFRPRLLCSALALCFVASAMAESFKVKDIRVEGLQRVSAGTVFSYLPIKVGQSIDLQKTSTAISQLYSSNLFSNINLARDGNILVVQVTEFPVISEIELAGNTSIKTATVKEAFAKAGFAEGRAYNPAQLQDTVNEMYRQYQGLNKFQVKITPIVTNLPRGRVKVKFDIAEGRTAQIKQIDFVGNKVYPSTRLRKLMDTDTTGWLSFATKDDQINDERLQADYDRISSFYRDRGFYDFAITSSQITLSQDKTKAYIAVNVSEGQPYTLTDYTVTGNLVIPRSEVEQLISIKKNALYDKSTIDASVTAIKDRLADEGYAKATVDVVPEVDQLTHKVKVNLAINPGNLVTVRRIEFTGNKKSYDSVLRRELRQQEMAPYSASDIERGEQRIRRLPQIQQLDKTLVPVEGYPDQVDIVYTVQERSTSYMQGGVGYGQSSGALFSLEYTDDNFFGSGNRLNVNFSKGSSQQSYGLTFTDPYFTDDGISSSFAFNYYKYDYSDEELSDWTSNNLTFTQTFGFPLTEYQSVYFGGGYRRIHIRTGSKVASEISKYLDKHGRKFNEFVLNSSIVRDTTNNGYMANLGSKNSINGEITIPGSDETYYRLNLKHRSYFSTGQSDSLVFSLHGDVSYGNSYGNTKGGLPFYRNYYAGGISTIRGYRYGSVGPKYTNGDYAGGNFMAVGGAELMMPISFNERSSNLRIGTFIDGGYAWGRLKDARLKDMRYSAGLFMQWMSPIGPLNLSYGVPLNKKKNDEKESFQFTIGTSF